MQITTESLDREAAYKLVTGAVVPRPIAWVTSLGDTGVVNLAPFSAFTFLSSYPPILGFNVGLREGREKDSALNIKAAREYVVNIADESMVEAVHNSSMAYPREVSEVEALGLAQAPSVRVKTPRLANAPVSMECRLLDILSFGGNGSSFIVGEVVMFHVRDEIIQNGKIDSSKMRPLCRLAGPNYAGLGDVVTLRPITPWKADSPLPLK
jgi:flavin reductase (DIM6/NTAB) family NADH-FMN oxidoreductase RutF